MAITNHERVGKALDLLKEGLQPFIERELQAQHGKYWITTVTSGWRNDVGRLALRPQQSQPAKGGQSL